jgi:hypothetical protein
MDSAVLFVIMIVVSVVLGYFAHKNKWKITEFF